MKKKELEELLEEILKSRDIFKVFLGLKWPPSEVLEGIMRLQHPDAKGVISAVARKHKVGRDYLLQQIDRILRQLKEIKENNPYSILGVAPDASQSQIKDAWKEKVRQWHPDKNRDRLEEAQRKTRRYNEAYELLRDPKRRLTYDRAHLPLIILLQGLEMSKFFSNEDDKASKERVSPSSTDTPTERRRGGFLKKILKLAIVLLCLASIGAWAGHYGVNILLKREQGSESRIAAEDDLSITPPVATKRNLATPSLPVEDRGLPEELKKVLKPHSPGSHRKEAVAKVSYHKDEKMSQKTERPLIAVAPFVEKKGEAEKDLKQPEERSNKSVSQKLLVKASTVSKPLKEKAGVGGSKESKVKKEKKKESKDESKKSKASKATKRTKKGINNKRKKKTRVVVKKTSKPVVSKVKRNSHTGESEEKVDESLLAIVLRELRGTEEEEKKDKAEALPVASHTLSSSSKPVKKEKERPKSHIPKEKPKIAKDEVKEASPEKKGEGKERPTKVASTSTKKPLVASTSSEKLTASKTGVEKKDSKEGKVSERKGEEEKRATQKRKAEKVEKKPLIEKAEDTGRDEAKKEIPQQDGSFSAKGVVPEPLTKKVVYSKPDTNALDAKNSKERSFANAQQKLGMALAWDLVERFVDSYRSGDIDTLVSIFSSDAVDNGNKFRDLIPQYRYQFKTFDVQYYKVTDPKIVPLQENQYLVKGRYKMALGIKGGAVVQHLKGPISWKICSTPKGLKICELTSSVE